MCFIKRDRQILLGVSAHFFFTIIVASLRVLITQDFEARFSIRSFEFVRLKTDRDRLLYSPYPPSG
jgi:hypothetical protein